jgi:hypothetical protein
MKVVMLILLVMLSWTFGYLSNTEAERLVRDAVDHGAAIIVVENGRPFIEWRGSIVVVPEYHDEIP